MRSIVIGAVLALCLSVAASPAVAAPGHGIRLLAGGGHVWEIGADGRPTASVSLAGHVFKIGPGHAPADYACEWTFRFADIAGTAYDGTVFHGTRCQDVVVWSAGNPGGPEAAMRIIVLGTLDRVPGYSMALNAVDEGEPGMLDQIRFRLYAGSDPLGDPSSLLYDSDVEFSSDAQRRTYLDAGNLQSWVDAPLS